MHRQHVSRFALLLLFLFTLVPVGSLTAALSPQFIRGDANIDGDVLIDDSITILSHLFVFGAPPLICQDAADVNDDGNVDISDVIYSLSYLFIDGSRMPPQPFPFCGADPTGDALDCADSSCHTYAPFVDVVVLNSPAETGSGSNSIRYLFGDGYYDILPPSPDNDALQAMVANGSWGVTQVWEYDATLGINRIIAIDLWNGAFYSEFTVPGEFLGMTTGPGQDRLEVLVHHDTVPHTRLWELDPINLTGDTVWSADEEYDVRAMTSGSDAEAIAIVGGPVGSSPALLEIVPGFEPSVVIADLTDVVSFAFDDVEWSYRVLRAPSGFDPIVEKYFGDQLDSSVTLTGYAGADFGNLIVNGYFAEALVSVAGADEVLRVTDTDWEVFLDEDDGLDHPRNISLGAIGIP